MMGGAPPPAAIDTIQSYSKALIENPADEKAEFYKKGWMVGSVDAQNAQQSRYTGFRVDELTKSCAREEEARGYLDGRNQSFRITPPALTR